MKRSRRGFWIGSVVFLLGFGVLPYAASGLFKSPQADPRPTREGRPAALRRCGQNLASSREKEVVFWAQTPTANYDCLGGPGKCR